MNDHAMAAENGSRQSLVRRALLARFAEPRSQDGVVRLPSERTLAAELGVSRPTVRAVLREFVAQGRLEVTHGLGYFLSSRSTG